MVRVTCRRDRLLLSLWRSDDEVAGAWERGIAARSLWRQSALPADAPRRFGAADLHRPPIQHGADAGTPPAADGARRRRRPRRFPRAALPYDAPWRRGVRRRLRRLPRLPGAAPVRGVPGARAPRLVLPPPRLPRSPLLQGAARRDFRAALLPERDHLGL